LLEKMLGIDPWCNKLCVLAKHLAEDLLTAPVNEYDAAEVDNSRKQRVLLEG